MHAYIHTCICACMHTYMHTCMHTYMHTCMHTYIHTCMHTYIHAFMHACIHIYIHTHLRGGVELDLFHIMSVPLSLCIHVYSYIRTIHLPTTLQVGCIMFHIHFMSVPLSLCTHIYSYIPTIHFSHYVCASISMHTHILIYTHHTCTGDTTGGVHHVLHPVQRPASVWRVDRTRFQHCARSPRQTL